MKDFIFYYVQTIAECKSVSKAAQKLFISQPALTKAINRLEKELNVKLFDRTKHPVELTYAGEKYLSGMSNVLAMQNQLQIELDEIANMKKERLNIGVPNTRSRRWLPAILPHFLRDYPEIDLRITEGTTAVLEQKLLDESIDVAIAITLPLMSPYLEYDLLCQEQMMFLTGVKHQLFKDMDLSDKERNKNCLYYINPERINNAPYISADPSQGLYRFSNQLFNRYSVAPHTVLSITNTSTARDLAIQGLGFVILPTSDALSQRIQGKDYVCFSIVDPPAMRDIISAYKKDRPLSTAAKHFLAITKQAAVSEQLLPVRFPLSYNLDY